MKILYGVQGTGNGHITRAREMAPLLKAAGAQVDFVFSGRDPAAYFDMEPFGNYRAFSGLTLKMRGGKLDYLATTLGNHPLQFLGDLRAMDTRGYDRVITDFEPVVAWAARRQRTPVIGFGHQYAFRHRVPLAGDNLAGRLVFSHFAPVATSVGLHWHHFDQPILPPVIEVSEIVAEPDPQLVLVYLPSVDPADLQQLLGTQAEFRFHVYCGVTEPVETGNVTLMPFSRRNFVHDLERCGAVICNAGFALVSEVLALGKRALVIPLRGHMEQLSNAAALRQLGYTSVAQTLQREVLDQFLASSDYSAPRHYRGVAAEVVTRIVSGEPLDDMDWVKRVWQKTTAA